MIPNPIHKVLSTLSSHEVRHLLMGGQACVFYGAAEFSRDCDIVIVADDDNLARLTSALEELQADCIAVPPLDWECLARGHALHFRCKHPDALNIRLDVMTKMRGCDEFDQLWQRRTTLQDDDGSVYELLGIEDLVKAKKTQRDKDYLLGKLSCCAWTCLKAEAGRLLEREDVVPGMIVAIQTHGELLHWHPHFHVLITCGAFTREGDFLELPEFDMERLLIAWQEAVFALYLAEEKIQPEVVENMRTWPHSGFSRPSLRDGARQSVYLAAGDQAGIERLVQYMSRCPFSLSRLVKVSDTGQVIYQAEKQACRAFPDPKGDGTQTGVPRNFQILSPLDFLAEFTQHIPPKGSHLIRGHRPKVGRGWYSNKSRGMRKKAEAAVSDEPSSEQPTTSRSSQAWAMLIKRLEKGVRYQLPERPEGCFAQLVPDPFFQCGGQMKVVSFIEPPQPDVIEAILKHCGLWQARSARAPPEVDDLVLELDAAYADSSLASVDQADESQTYVDIDTFLASF